MGTKLISIVVCLLTCAGCQQHMVALETNLRPAKHDRTQKPRQKSGEPLLVPQGTKLLSRGAKVTCSVEDGPVIGKLDMITDGNEKAEDGLFYEVELGPGLQWVQLDLGKPYALYAILVWHYYSPYRTDYHEGPQVLPDQRPHVFDDVVVQISDDPAFKKDVTTVFNNDHDNSSGLGKGKDDTYVETSEGRWINTKGVEGRYVRLYSRGYRYRWHRETGDMNRYIEVEVYGK